jgi:hypothetical protein
MRVPAEELRRLPLEVHALLADVPLQDVSAVEPFRRFIVYPALLRTVRRAWIDRYASAG